MLTILKPIIIGQLRHLLTAGAAVLVAKGYLEASMVEAVVGAATYAIGAGWSAYEKKGR
jgi:hypothetical protein